jgi:hypothetical protein
MIRTMWLPFDTSEEPLEVEERSSRSEAKALELMWLHGYYLSVPHPFSNSFADQTRVEPQSTQQLDIVPLTQPVTDIFGHDNSQESTPVLGQQGLSGFFFF